MLELNLTSPLEGLDRRIHVVPPATKSENSQSESLNNTIVNAVSVLYLVHSTLIVLKCIPVL